MRFQLYLLVTALSFALQFTNVSGVHAAERSLDGGAHIWAGQDWGSFRAHVGPRYAWDWFSIRPNGAIGMAFITGVERTVTSFGGYMDFDATVPLEGFRAMQFGVGGGVGHNLGMHAMTGPVIPQGYVQAGYRWDVNYVGIMALVGPKYRTPAGYPDNMPDSINFSGVGLRFEYQIDRGD